MTTEPLGEIFDPLADYSTTEHLRPHWSQAGTIVFITFRTVDSIPREVLMRWDREKTDWIQMQTGKRMYWKDALPLLAPKLRVRFHKIFNRCREQFLDSGRRECVLGRPEFAKIVADSLIYFDRDRYRMGDFIVMPNHVLLLAAFFDESTMRAQCDSWLHYTARQINLALGRKGKFWQQEPFDHLVRSIEQYAYLRRYIRDNGTNAGLHPDQYYYRRYE